MNKKIAILTIMIITIIVVLIIFFIFKNNNKEIGKIKKTNNNTESNNVIVNNEFSNNTINENRIEFMNIIYIKVNNHILNIELEDNLATKSLIEKLKNGDIIIDAHDYGGFEKIGSLGFSLPKEDENITTSVGDIVLYQGNQISLFYNSNSWNYTKLGKIQNISATELKNILGNGDVTLTITISK